MDWSALGTQFCLEIGFGLLLALAFVPRAPVGVLFYRIMGTAAMVPLACAAVLPRLAADPASESPWLDASVILPALAVAAYPVYSGPTRGIRWVLGLCTGLVGASGALVVAIDRADVASGPGLALASLTALATGAVAGSVALAMVLGHWYLTVPNLDVRHLARLNRVAVVSMLVSLGLIGASCLVFSERIETLERPLFGAWGLFHLGTRVAVGLLLPLSFAWMTASSLRFENTRSATGILYASTVLVLIGTAVSISLQDSYGVPL